MDGCTKFKLFNMLLVFCVANFLLYRYFSHPTSTLVVSFSSEEEDKDKPISKVVEESSLNSSRTILSTDFKKAETNSIDHSIAVNISKANGTATEAIPTPTQDPQSLPQCPLVPPRLNGPLATFSDATWENIEKENPLLKPGGRYKPPDCIARHKVAIVIPYRNREAHLRILLRNLHPMLMRQQLDYGIFVVDQALPGRFNRAMLMNIGYAEAMKRYDYQCAVFHDVDLIPENDRNIYSCPEQPRHLSAAIDKFKYRLPYANIYGGVSAVKKEQFEKFNGFSNMFFGWGGEDDDISARIRHSGLKITRYPMEIARYKMIKHLKDSGNEQNPQRFSLLKTVKQRMATDGLNSLKYTVQAVEDFPSYLRIQVLINEDDITKKKS